MRRFPSTWLPATPFFPTEKLYDVSSFLWGIAGILHTKHYICVDVYLYIYICIYFLSTSYTGDNIPYISFCMGFFFPT